MNIFYTKTEQVFGDIIELAGQEARHASKVMRYREGDRIDIVDGEGVWYECEVEYIVKDSLKARIQNQRTIPAPSPRIVAALGLIKKRDRLEFAVEKAVELGAKEIVLFKSRHTVKQNVRMDRLEAAALSAMKQSLRAWLPEVKLFDTIEQVLQEYSDSSILLAHKTKDEVVPLSDIQNGKKLLILVGPEGGFSKWELDLAQEHGAKMISLGAYRLRAETALLAFLSRLQ